MPLSIEDNAIALNNPATVIRSWLFVPATKIELIVKAFASGAEAVIVDLEDTVAKSNKAQARIALQKHCHSEDYQPVWLRINKAGSNEFAKDLALCQQLSKLSNTDNQTGVNKSAGKNRLAGIVLAKAEQAIDIEKVHKVTGLPVIALIESAMGLYNIDAMAKAGGLVAFSYGFLDLCNDLQVQVDTEAAVIIANQIRYQLIVSSKVHKLSPPIDTIYPDFKDDEGLSKRVKLWSQMGMAGMLCIHPKQVAIVNQALQPTAAEVDFAKRVVEEYERSGKAIFKIADQMIDAPVIQRCYRILGG